MEANLWLVISPKRGLICEVELKRHFNDELDSCL